MMGDRITHYNHETWTWFPDGDERRAMTRVIVTTDSYGDFHGSRVSYALDVINGALEYIAKIEPNPINTSDVTIYGKSAFRDTINFMYERPATENEVNLNRILRDEQRKERREQLLRQLEELDNDN